MRSRPVAGSRSVRSPDMLRLACVLSLIGAGLALRLVVLHTNDMHSRIDEIAASTAACRPPSPCYGGFARVAGVAKSMKDNNTVFLNAGDNFQGTPYYFVFKWRIIAQLIDKLGIDVMSLGNHEFDDGVSGLEPFLKTVKTPSLAANLNLTLTPGLAQGNLHKSWNLNIGGVNVSIIGYLTPKTSYLARPRPVKFLDEIPVLQKLSKEAKAQGAKIVIALGHSGFEMDKEIAENVPDVDVVVGGHSDTFLYTGTPPDTEVPESTYPHMVTQASGKKVPVVQAYGYTKYLGHLVLEFDDQYNLVSATGNPILLDSSKPQDPALVAEILRWKQNMTVILDEEVASSLVDLVGDCRDKECNLGNFIADAIVDYHAQTKGPTSHQWTNAPISIMNGGSIRTSIPLIESRGRISEGDLLTVIPFDNPMSRVILSGEVLKDVLETSVRRYDPVLMRGAGSFLQMSGLRVTYDLEHAPGSRVTHVEALCGACTVPSYSPLRLNDTYSILVTEYIAQGGDEYSQFLEAPGVKIEMLHWNDLEAVRSYMVKRQPIFPALEGRIRFLPEDVRALYSSADLASSPLIVVAVTLVINFFLVA
ncbi:snake venom 5'-nucleotidase [Halyomorpha halys]|uniref:snake venom 5'-nucleotidase n=1 Tax=Halyomorpha halys TaxID=286706 RepID=UPI0006D502E7|nr:protein 5NUC-like [Halyomorpha halys]